MSWMRKLLGQHRPAAKLPGRGTPPSEPDQAVVRELTDMPRCSIGAPIPFVLAGGDGPTVLAYYMEEDDGAHSSRGWASARPVTPHTPDLAVALVRFVHCTASYLGPPNDEAFTGHPLASRGLQRYRAFEVENSPWISQLERMNSVHPNHDPSLFRDGIRHFIFSFHDETFECIATDYAVEVARGTIADLMQRQLTRAAR